VIDIKLEDIKRIMVVGAGTMGHSIAQTYATAGYDVDLVDLNKDTLDHALEMMESNLHTLADANQINRDSITSILDRIHPSVNIKTVARDVDLAVEAVNEQREVKAKLFKLLENICKEDTIFASNTSGINVFKLAKIKNPGRMVIHHWFAPPHIIPLVEIVPSRKTSAETIEISKSLLKKLGKIPVVLKKFINSFIVNKIQNALTSVVYELLLRNVTTVQDLDLAIKASLGIRLPIVGVVQTQDFTGLDLVSDIAKSLGKIVPNFIKNCVEQGNLGAKTGKGLYDYGERSEIEITKKRDILYLKNLQNLEKIDAFKPI
jgi:3-hydroxybutyryl-CoA dehydrogenase